MARVVQTHGGHFGNPDATTQPTTATAPVVKATATPSAPVATNVGKAPMQAAVSETVAFTPDGSTQPTKPLEIPKAALGKPEQVVSSDVKPALKEGWKRVVLTFEQGKDDVDTVHYTDPATKEYLKCRFEASDGPEITHGDKPGQPYGKEAAAYLQSLVDGKTADIFVSKKDFHGRNVCQIEINGEDLDHTMIKAGASMLYRAAVAPGTDRFKKLYLAEEEAIENKRGMWAKGNDVQYPAHFRRDLRRK